MNVKDKMNTLVYNPKLCTNCGLCSIVCPWGVFEPGEHTARLVNRGACIECGACAFNCEPGAIEVEAGVGCAAAMIQAALTSRTGLNCESNCGPYCGCD